MTFVGFHINITWKKHLLEENRLLELELVVAFC